VAELGADEQQPDPGVADQVAGLRWGEPEVDGYQDGACPQARQRGFDVRGAALVQDRDPVAGPQARSELGCGVAVDLVGELRPGP